MIDPLETELKLELDPADRDRLAALPQLEGRGGAPRSLVSTYFDTPDLALHAAGVTLRVRAGEDGFLQTAKAAGAGAAGLFARPEWERTVPEAQPVIDAASGPVAALLDGRLPEPRFVTTIARRVWHVGDDAAEIEVALDAGEIRADGATLALCELELELKRGPAAALFALARTLGAAVPLKIAVESKSDRGFRLLAGGGTRAVKAGAIALDPTQDARAAFATIAASCFRQFRLNEARLAEGGDAAALHQARVGLRRLRSAFTLFKRLHADDSVARRLRGELRWLAGTLGAVRNLDVLIAASHGDARARLAEARAAAFATALTALGSPRARTVQLDLAEWLALGAWRAPAGTDEQAHGAIELVAADRLERLTRRVRKRGRHLARLDDAARHRLRIEAKKLRYAAEFFASLWPGKKARRRHRAFLEALEALQDALGALNDQAVAQGILAGLDLPPDALAPTRDRAALLADAAAAHDALGDVKRFWRR